MSDDAADRMASFCADETGTRRPKTVYDYFWQAPRRSRKDETGDGKLVFGANGNCAVFFLQAAEGRITEASFRCTSCFTLVAFCEHLSELAIGLSGIEARKLGPDRLVGLHPEVPSHLHNRAVLATAAFQEAVQTLIDGGIL
jgi:hypothetical protein